MTAAPWLCAALLCWQLNVSGALPREVTVCRARPYAAGESQVRLLIFKDSDAIYVRPDSPLHVENPRTDERLATVAAGAMLTLRPSRGRVSARADSFHLTDSHLRFRPAGDNAGSTVSSRGGWGRRGSYPGVLEVSATSRGLRLVEYLDLDAYVAGVVAAEMPRTFPLEAMKAQAVAARTYALYHLGDHEADGADLCARVHCQAYAGQPPPDSVAAEATRQTAGLVLAWNELLVDALYHSACGGATSTAWDVRQGKLLPYLLSVEDSPSADGVPYCAQDHDVRWSQHFSRRQADRLLAANLPRVLYEPRLSPGRLQNLHLAAVGSGGRAEWLEIATTTDTYRVRGDAIRWLFGEGYAGPRGLRSSAFELSVETNAQGAPVGFSFRGRGHGHGLGLCQWGARGRALSGQTAEEILAAYYTGAMLVDLRP